MSEERTISSSCIVHLLVRQGERVVHAEPLAGRALIVGRGPDNDLVFVDPSVSARHAVFWLDAAGELRVRDLGSTNGTSVNGARISAPTLLGPGDEVLLGSGTCIEVRCEQGACAPSPPPPPSLLVDLDSGVAWPVTQDRLYVGEGPDCQIQLPGAPMACIALHDNGEIWLSTEDSEQPIEPGSPFTIGSRELVFRSPASVLAPTRRDHVERVSHGYTLEVELNGTTGPEARFRCPDTGRQHRITAENRVSLLWVLGQRLLDDLQAGLDRAQAGWCADDEVACGVWGARAHAQGSNNLQVLVFRTRQELTRAGFDGWVIEKRRGHTRLLLHGVSLVG